MNSTITTMLRHRSVRKFKDQPVEPEKLELIIQSAQMASTSSNVQAYSVIGVTDPKLKKELAVLAGNQAYIEQCPIFLVWCADLYRLREASRKHGEPFAAETTENFIIGTVDTALAAQNAAVAAEAQGLGIVYIGGIRNRIAEVTKLLKLPELVYPVFGMCLGYPDQQTLLRPRLAKEAVFHLNGYDKASIEEHINDYDRVVREYMKERTGGKVERSWSEQMAEKMKVKARAHMKSYLESQGFPLQ